MKLIPILSCNLFLLFNSCCYTRIGDIINTVGTLVPKHEQTRALSECKFYLYEGKIYMEVPFRWQGAYTPDFVWCMSMIDGPRSFSGKFGYTAPTINTPFEFNEMALISMENATWNRVILGEDIDITKAQPLELTLEELQKLYGCTIQQRNDGVYVNIPHSALDVHDIDEIEYYEHTWHYYAMRPISYVGHVLDVPFSISATILGPVIAAFRKSLTTSEE